MQRMFVVVLATAVVAVTWLSVALAQVGDHFDTARTATIKGTVVEFAVGPGPRSYLLIETKDATGKPETWAVQGNGVGVLIKAGWNVREQVKLGSMITATTYALKSNAPAVEVPPNASDRVVKAVSAQRLAHGIDVTFPDGKTLPFGPSK